MERKLASIQRIREIRPIEGADAIDLAVVNSWQVVVAKNVGHKVGDLVVYCEIDSYLPIEPEFEFLRKSSYKKMPDGSEGFRLKTIKLRGQVSQGLIIPVNDAYAIYKRSTPNLDMGWFEGLDVTEMLNIIKYEPPISAELSGKVKGYFPSFLRKTDEERCLSEDTIIDTEDGLMTIKAICETKYTGKVLSYNTVTDQDEMNAINSHSIQNNNNDWYEVLLESGKTIIATGNHRIWLPELKCFREVRELLGNEVVKINKKTDV